MLRKCIIKDCRNTNLQLVFPMDTKYAKKLLEFAKNSFENHRYFGESEVGPRQQRASVDKRTKHCTC